MNSLKKKPALRKTVATALFVFGTVAIILPIIPGWVMIGFGLYLLSIDSPTFDEKVSRYRAKSRLLDGALRHSYDRFHAKDKLKSTEPASISSVEGI